MSPTVNTDGGIRSDFRVKVERTKVLTVAWGSSLLDWGQEISWSWSLSFSVLAMARKEVIVGAPDGYWYSVHAIDGSGSLRWDNVERRICRCDSSTSGSGVEVIAPKSEALHASLAVLPIADTSAECRWRKEECGDMTGLKFEDLQLKTAVK